MQQGQDRKRRLLTLRGVPLDIIVTLGSTGSSDQIWSTSLVVLRQDNHCNAIVGALLSIDRHWNAIRTAPELCGAKGTHRRSNADKHSDYFETPNATHLS